MNTVLTKFTNTIKWYVNYLLKYIIVPSNVIPSNPSRAISSMTAVTKL